MALTLLSALRSPITLSNESVVASAEVIRTIRLSHPSSAATRCLFLTYWRDAGSSPTRIAASVGLHPKRLLRSSMCARNSGIRCALSARPSMMIAAIGYQSIIALDRAEQGAVDRTSMLLADHERLSRSSETGLLQFLR